MSCFSIKAFYKFIPLSNCAALREELVAECQKRGILGTILLAEEGINATLAGGLEELNQIVAFIQQNTSIGIFDVKDSVAQTQPFSKLKVRLKNEIVTMGVPDIKPYEKKGTYVNWRQWNQLLDDPDTVVLDVRNDYEIDIGTFPSAINPQTMNFKQFPHFVKNQLDPSKMKKIAMCCTGGIRCEKASAYMLEHGFDQVFHLEGGILKYLEEVDDQENKWQGECFVFDDRVSVTQQLTEGRFSICQQCYDIKPSDKIMQLKDFVCEDCLD